MTPSGITRRRFLQRAGSRAAVVLGSAPFVAHAQSIGPELLVGAHYYVWFPAPFQGGRYLRAKLRPAQTPLLGEYSSAARKSPGFSCFRVSSACASAWR